jgi:hypothetical protein
MCDTAIAQQNSRHSFNFWERAGGLEVGGVGISSSVVLIVIYHNEWFTLLGRGSELADLSNICLLY